MTMETRQNGRRVSTVSEQHPKLVGHAVVGVLAIKSGVDGPSWRLTMNIRISIVIKIDEILLLLYNIKLYIYTVYSHNTIDTSIIQYKYSVYNVYRCNVYTFILNIMNII